MSNIQITKFLEDDKNNAVEGETNLFKTIKKLLNDIEEIKNQKNDTTNLKNSYKQFVEDHNATFGELKARLNAVEELLKQLLGRITRVENL